MNMNGIPSPSTMRRSLEVRSPTSIVDGHERMSSPIIIPRTTPAMNALARIRRSRTSHSTPERRNSHKESWPNPQESVGCFITAVGAQSCWEAIGPARAAFPAVGRKIKNYLDDYSEPIPIWVTWSIYMVGNTPETAVPTIIFCCAEESYRKKIRNTIKTSNILADYPGIALKHLPRAPDYNQLVQLAREDSAFSLVEYQASERPSTNPIVFCTARRITPGTQLFIRKNGLSNVVTKATAGGLLRVGEQHYLMTAEHAFTDVPEPSMLPRNEELCFTDSEDDDDDIETTSRGSCTPHSQRSVDSQESTSFRSHRSSGVWSQDDVESVDNLAEPNPLVSYQEDGLSSGGDVSDGTPSCLPANAFAVGKLIISSSEGSHPELDYALIEITDASLLDDGHAWIPPSLLAAVNHGARKTPANSSNLEVISYTASGGFVSGSRSGTPAYIRPPHVKSYQEVYPVSFNNPLSKGDCGSWVIDPRSGALIGHIVAGSPEIGAAYIVLAEQVFQDLQRQLNLAPIPCLGKGQCNIKDSTSGSASRQASSADQITQDLPADVSLAHDLSLRFRAVLSQNRLRSLTASKARATSTSREAHSTTPLLSDRAAPPSYISLRNLPLVPTAPKSTMSRKFCNILISLSSYPLHWENPGLLDEALRVVPLERIYAEAEEEHQFLCAKAESLRSGKKPTLGFQDCTVRAILRWFKDSFFTWVNDPPCSYCSSPTIGLGRDEPLPDEFARGAKQVELYKCSDSHCGHYERFARYDDAFVLLETRRGRTGEWANCFGMLCRAIGCRVRWIWTSEDYVWIEVYSDHQERWIHVDPCETVWDKPRLYTEGWGKKFAYCIAFSTDGAVDVTRRYARSSRYAADRTRCSEGELVYIVDHITGLRRGKLSTNEKCRLEAETIRESRELRGYIVSGLVAEVCKLHFGELRDGSIGVVSESDSRKAAKRTAQSAEADVPRYVE